MIELIPVKLGIVNSYIIRQNGNAVIIDTGASSSGKKLTQTLKKLNLEKEVKLIIITHGHTDHYGGASAIRQITGAPILVHEMDAANFSSGNNGPLNPQNAMGKMICIVSGNSSSNRKIIFEPDLVLKDKFFDLDSFGIDGTVVHTPGHTAGSVSVLLKDGMCFTGDSVMSLFPPRTRPRLPAFCENPHENIQSLNEILSGNCTTLYPGHGGPFNREDVARLIMVKSVGKTPLP